MEGRCGHKVVSKIGLEVHDDVLDTVFSDDDSLIRVVLSDGEHETELSPEYEDVLPMLRKEWNMQAVIIEEETDDAIDHERIEIEDDDPYVTNRGTHLDGFCMRYPLNDGTYCYVHERGGRAEKGHSHGIKHGLYTHRLKFFDWLEEEGRDKDIEFIHMMVDSWLDDAPFDRDNTAKVNELYRCAVDQLRAWYAIDEYVDKEDGPHNESGKYSGLAYKRVVGTNEEGEEIEVFDESPLNLPYSRLERDTQTKLKNMGIYDSPEQQNAEATQSLAQALSGDNDSN